MSYPTIDFLFLSEEDMIKAGVKDMAACIDSMEEVIKCLNVGDYVIGGENHNSHGSQVSFPLESPFPNMPLDTGDDRRFMAMPAYIGGSIDMMGMKWYGSNSDNRNIGLPRSILTVMLNDKTTGEPISLMYANILSAVRTGAVPGVGAKYLAKKDSKVCGICGPGVMGKT
jgi:ornithine cyclodeaminase